ncbi:porphobilinogen deaminase [Homalodisca vitripennis]|uniref:porphobilinogen deaminase n=1 Tax=Homalodisca vitripennis TaxID=197043 RepID=UPI001EEC4ED5|nr:porphobilinogen deaminase [Homalodisca vitripennis]
MNNQEKTIKVGSRKSELALIQTRFIIRKLEEVYPEKKFEIVTMSTLGDQILDKPLPKIGEKSLFTKELETALEQSHVDFVVHSLKDLPTILPEGMAIGAICKREDPRDAVIFNPKFKGKTLETLPENSIIGTSSLRRTAQLSRYFPHLRVEDIRGNLNTRLRKLEAEESKYAAIVLALAGITRMDWEDRVGQVLESEEMLYAVGQGALAVECRENDLATMALLEPLHHRATTARVVAERSFLCTLGGGCSAPVAVQSTLRERTLALTGAVWSLDGSQTLRQASTCRLRSDPVNDDYEPPRKCPYREPRLFVGVAQGLLSPRDLEAAEKLGADLAAELIRDGALEIMCAAKKLVTASIS